MRLQLKNRIGPVATHLAAAALALAGCGDGTDPNEVVQYHFSLAALGGDTTVERVRNYGCQVHGFFDLVRPVPASGTVRFPVRVSRDLFERRGSHIESTSADSTIAEAVLDYVGLGQDSLRFVLGAGPYTATLGPGGITPYAEYSGEWICGPEVPLAQDSTLLAYGYDPDLPMVGTWRVFELIPFE